MTFGPGLQATGYRHGRPSEKPRKSLSFASSCGLIRGFPANLANPANMSRLIAATRGSTPCRSAARHLMLPAAIF
jgi:hypothetical protein